LTGEEKGLLGSGFFARNPTVPIDSIVANINLDMPLFTYPFADVIAFGAEHSTLEAFVRQAAGRADIALSPDPMPEQGLFVRSDHYKLVQEGVPAVFLVTGFQSKDPEINAQKVFQDHLREHYHQPSDDTNLPIDYAAGAIFTEININIGREICNSPERPRWNEGDFFGRTFAAD
jgi:Zn-dependent M28 family amino/carboxypeptidase